VIRNTRINFHFEVPFVQRIPAKQGELMADEPHMAARLLGHEMKALRRSADYTLTEVARATTMSAAKISRIENGKMRTQPGDILYLCTLYHAEQEHIDQLRQLAESTFAANWWEQYRQGMTDKFWFYVRLEQFCSTLLSHDNTFFPDLLQTPEYVEAVLANRQLWDMEDIDQAQALKIDRVTRYWENDRSTSRFLIGEAAFLLGIGSPGVRRRQIEHMCAMEERDDVEIGVIMLDRGSYSGMGTEYRVLDFRDERDPATVYVVSMRNLAYLNKPGDVEIFRQSFEQARSCSIPLRSYYETATTLA
jgi:transcriptional regulator with XRE-family HTH domain